MYEQICLEMSGAKEFTMRYAESRVGVGGDRESMKSGFGNHAWMYADMEQPAVVIAFTYVITSA